MLNGDALFVKLVVRDGEKINGFRFHLPKTGTVIPLLETKIGLEELIVFVEHGRCVG